jgi:hypothetical protein
MGFVSLNVDQKSIYNIEYKSLKSLLYNGIRLLNFFSTLSKYTYSTIHVAIM